jgi:hypothetical protein
MAFSYDGGFAVGPAITLVAIHQPLFRPDPSKKAQVGHVISATSCSNVRYIIRVPLQGTLSLRYPICKAQEDGSCDRGTDGLKIHTIIVTQRSNMGNKLYVGNLPFSATDDSLREMFGQAGQVESARIITDRDTGRSKGFGFVEMSTEQEASEAIKKFNGQELDGRSLTVNEARPMAPREGGGGGGRGQRGGGGRQRW